MQKNKLSYRRCTGEEYPGLPMRNLNVIKHTLRRKGKRRFDTDRKEGSILTIGGGDWSDRAASPEMPKDF